MWNIYDTMLRCLPPAGEITGLIQTDFWTLAELSGGSCGLAMTTRGDTVAAEAPDFPALSPSGAAALVKSWNLTEASKGMAVINACYNTRFRMDALACREPWDCYCTRGLDLTGKKIGVVGHLRMPEEILANASEVFILERHPQPGDYPDTACEYLLPKCDAVLITGSSLVNKTLPRLLELSRNAYTIVTGPTVPMCPELLGCGIDRLAGLVVNDPEGIRAHVAASRPGPPYPYGETFLLTEERI